MSVAIFVMPVSQDCQVCLIYDELQLEHQKQHPEIEKKQHDFLLGLPLSFDESGCYCCQFWYFCVE